MWEKLKTSFLWLTTDKVWINDNLRADQNNLLVEKWTYKFEDWAGKSVHRLKHLHSALRQSDTPRQGTAGGRGQVP